MSTARAFAEGYTSFWSQMLPTGDRYIRNRNLQIQRFAPPLSSSVETSQRSFVNELSFRLFSVSQARFETFSEEQLTDAIGQTTDYISRFRDSRSRHRKRPVKSEIEEALELRIRLSKFFSERIKKQRITFFPYFEGCGIVNACDGDLLVGATLFEIKAGDRNLRLIDVKQTLIYCALNYAKGDYIIDAVGFVNPRVGVFRIESLNDLALATSGTTASFLLGDIVDFISQPAGSR
jgi:hypothetical protein